MRFRYWTVQVRPTPTSITQLGIGVIVEDPSTGELAHRFVEKPHTLLSHYSNSNIAARIIGTLSRWIDAASATPIPLEIDERFVTEGILDTMVHRWNNLITINHRQYVSADSLQDAIDLLFQKLIYHGEGATKTQRVARVRQSVRKAYESKESLRELIISRPELTIDDDLGERFDLGVIRGTEILELNDAFSLQSSDPRQTANRIQAWTWKMSALRESGAQLIMPGGELIEVNRQTPIVAAFWPPKTDSEHELLSSMSRRWDHLEIEYIEVDQIGMHAEKLSRRAA